MKFSYNITTITIVFIYKYIVYNRIMTKYLSLVLTIFIFVVVDKNRYLFETTMNIYFHQNCYLLNLILNCNLSCLIFCTLVLRISDHSIIGLYYFIT